MSESSSDQTAPPVKGRGMSRLKKLLKWCFIIVLIFVVLLVVLAFLLNGPLGRKLIKDELLKKANQEDFHGDLTLSGTLLNGYTFSDVNFTGPGIEELSIGELTVNYTIRELLEKKIDLVKVDSLKARVDIAKLPKSSEEKEESEDRSFQEIMEEVRPMALNPEIQITNLDVTILKEEKLLTAVKLDSLSHASGADKFKMEGFMAKNADRLDTKPQDVTLEWREESLSLDEWEVLPGLIIRDSEFDWFAEPLIVDSGLIAGGAVLTVKIEDDIRVELEEGILTTNFLVETFGIEIPLDASLDKVSARILNWKLPFPKWNIDADLHLTEAVYQEYDISDVSLKLAQSDKKYDLGLEGVLNEIPVELDLKGEWNAADGAEKWWDTTKATYEVSVPKVGDLLELWVEELDERIDYSKVSLNAMGLVALEGSELTDATTVAQVKMLEIMGERMPDLFLNGRIEGGDVVADLSVGSQTQPEVVVGGKINLEEKRYEGALLVNTENVSWVNTLLRFAGQEIVMSDKIGVSWSGVGTLSSDQNELEGIGALEVSKLTLKLPDDGPTLNCRASIGYDFPNYIAVESIEVQKSDWKANGTLFWDGDFLNVPAFGLSNKERDIVWGSGLVPYSLDIKNAEQFLSQEEEVNVHLTVRPLEFEKIQEWAGMQLPEGVTGQAEADFSIFGVLESPQLRGYANLIEVKGLEPNLNEALNAKLSFESLGETVTVNSIISEGVDDRVIIEGIFPFTPLEWVNDPNSLETLKESPIRGTCSVKSFPLERISEFVPDLEPIPGNAEVHGVFTGTINDPKFELELDVDVPAIDLESSTLGKIRDVKVNAVVKEDLKVATHITAEVDGGNVEVIGTVDVNDFKKPVCDLELNCDHILVFRDDLLSARANTALKLQGGIDGAVISGDIGITESLVFKDIELIPIGVPSSAVADVQLPALSSGSDDLPIPEPFASWKLDVNLKTEDPILIRGNIARGHVEGAIKVGGTLKRPSPNGAMYIKDTSARLPFSLLKIPNGQVIFSPQGGVTNPELKIAGESSIGGFDVNLLVYGDTSAPKTSFSSSPPLPEAEIMSLLATGSTTDSLENRDAVALKAFQIFLLKLQQRQDIPGGNQLFGALLTVIDKLNLQVGQDDEFTGRKFTSASLDLNEHWHFTTQIDEETRARGLIVYLIRFK